MKFNRFTFLVAFFFFSLSGFAQQEIASEEKQEVIETIGKLMDSIYVFPEVAEKAAALLKQNEQSGKYAAIINPHAFAEALTKDLYSVTADGHINVSFNPQAVKKENTQEPEEDPEMDIPTRLSMDNFGFHEVKVLPGNVGYIDLRLFYSTEHAAETAIAAMNFLANTDAIIFDLRKNRGGSPQMIQLIQSYLFKNQPVHLNNFYFRPTDEHTQTWTLPHVPGKRNPDAAVYVLTSNRTFSAGEEFTYNLKNLERATIIGETTGGGAHPGSVQQAGERFTIFIPSGRAINPITKTNWEGTGVKPHIEIPEEEALELAHLMALEKLYKEAKGGEAARFYEWHLKEIKAQQEPVVVSPQELKTFSGAYGSRKVEFDGSHLTYYYKGDNHEMIPLGDNEFAIEKMPFLRLGFSEDKQQLFETYDIGKKITHLRE